MHLIPKHPPGRSNRKARAYAADIARLRTEGYTLEAIRLTLADTGLQVSLSTVQREAARSTRHVLGADYRQVHHTPIQRVPPAAPPINAPPALGTAPRSAKEIAAEFMAKQITNPLVRHRSNQS